MDEPKAMKKEGTHKEQGTADGSAEMQASLWGECPEDWVTIAEQEERPWLGPAYNLVLDRLIYPGNELLDIGCGAGRFCRMASDRGARVTDIDATPELLAIARQRIPEADLRQGDMQFLPFADVSFDVVTGFNSFFCAADSVAAFREAARVLRPGGSLALTAFGHPERCQSSPLLEHLGPLMPKFESSGAEQHEPGVLEGLLEQAGLVRLAVRNSGEDTVRSALARRLAPPPTAQSPSSMNTGAYSPRSDTLLLSRLRMQPREITRAGASIQFPDVGVSK